MIRLHRPNGTFDFGKIAIVGDASPSEVMLTVEPSDVIKRAAEQRGSKRLPRSITMGFHIDGDHLQLRAIIGDSGTGGVVDEDAVESRLFDLVRCAD